MKTALISVSDKTGIVEFASNLKELGYRLVSTGGTLKSLKEAGLDVISISEITNFPEILDGRVKTLHPAVHAGLLSVRQNEDHMKALSELGIATIDLVCVNLYPFEETVKKENCTLEMAIENIDIGGPSMLRSAAKNYKSVIVVTDSSDYEEIIEKLKSGEGLDELKMRLALKVFQRTSSYDAAISNYLASYDEGAAKAEDFLADTIKLSLQKQAELRYGENPGQRAGLYTHPLYDYGIAQGEILNGKPMSYNNYLDANAALLALKEYDEAAAVCLKHLTPCGVAEADRVEIALERAIAADPVSVFGGIIAVNREFGPEAAEKMKDIFCEIIIAPSYSEEGLALLQKKKNLRVIRVDMEKMKRGIELRSISGGILVQDEDEGLAEDFEIVTKLAPSAEEMEDLKFAMKVVKHVKSNAIVVAKDKVTCGIGAGQVNRLWSTENAIQHSLVDVKGAVLASDAFFPFADGIEEAARAGIRAIIQPGGSIRDEEVIERANELGLKMVFTGRRHFKH